MIMKLYIYEVPLILFPQTPEQGAIAKRVEKLGAGIKLRVAREFLEKLSRKK